MKGYDEDKLERGPWGKLWREVFYFAGIWRGMEHRPAWFKGCPVNARDLMAVVCEIRSDDSMKRRFTRARAVEWCILICGRNKCRCGQAVTGICLPKAKTRIERIRNAYPFCGSCAPKSADSGGVEVRNQAAGEGADNDGAGVDSGSNAANHRSRGPRRNGDDRNALGYAKPAQPVAAPPVTLEQLMAAKAEAIARTRAGEVAARINAEKERLAEIDAKRFRARLDSACYQAGTTAAWITERCRSGNLKRGGDRIAKRNAVFHILRQMGMSYPEIGETCGINCSTVQTNMRDNRVGTFDSTEEAA